MKEKEIYKGYRINEGYCRLILNKNNEMEVTDLVAKQIDEKLTRQVLKVETD